MYVHLESFGSFRNRLHDQAFYLGCSSALLAAILHSRTRDDLSTTVRQAHGPGSAAWADWARKELEQNPELVDEIVS